MTDRRFTGQRENMEWGLYYYNARYYVPGLGRFASADTIVPDPSDPQSFNRYSYVLNNPVKYTDPTGHYIFEEEPEDPYLPSSPTSAQSSIVTFSGQWKEDEKHTVHTGALHLGRAYARTHFRHNNLRYRLGDIDSFDKLSGEEAFLAVHGGPAHFSRLGVSCAAYHSQPTWNCFGRSMGPNEINVFTDASGGIAGNVKWVIHELGHSFESAVNRIRKSAGYLDGLRDILAADKSILRRAAALRNGQNPNFGFAGPAYGWQQSVQDYAPGEEFADMVIGWTYSRWATNGRALTPQGSARSDFMRTHMPIALLWALGQ